jgi:hypothetical protein
MQKLSPLVLAMGAISFAAVPVQFTSGTSAKADEVNRNFSYLDSTKATKSSVDILTSAMVAKIDASEANTKLGAKVDTGTYGKFVREQATKNVVDTSAKRRVDSLAVATKTADTTLARRVTTVEGAVPNKVDKGTITTATIHAISDTNGVSQGPLVVKGLLSANGGISSGNLSYSGRILSLATESANYAPEISWVSKNGIGGTTGYDPTANGWYFYSASTKSQILKIPAAVGGNFVLGASTSIGGNLSANSVLVGTATTTTGSPVSITPAPNTKDWGDGPELIPSSTSHYAALYLRGNATDATGSIALARSSAGAFFIGYHELTTMSGTSHPSRPFEIDSLGRAYFGSSVKIGSTVYASAAEITDLRVAGTLKTSPTEPWADYVFEPGYKAMALKDVETFAKANGHLPEVPSAAEVAKDGIDLAKMNAILLKKIEELTLHAVAQEKKMEALSAKVEALQAERK